MATSKSNALHLAHSLTQIAEEKVVKARKLLASAANRAEQAFAALEGAGLTADSIALATATLRLDPARRAVDTARDDLFEIEAVLLEAWFAAREEA